MARLLRAFAALLLVAPSLSAQTFNLTGMWRLNNTIELYRFRQVDNRLYWMVDGTPQRGYVNLFVGLISGTTILGSWVDMPGSPRLDNRSTTLVLRIESNDRVVKQSEAGSVYNGNVWTRVSDGGAQPPAAATSTDTYKNGGTLRQEHRPFQENLASGAWKIGDQIRFTCLAVQMPPVGPVWGTNQYTTDSFTCYSAVHAGVIPASGGEIIATIGGRRERFEPSRQNGIESAPWGAWDQHISYARPSGGSGGTQLDFDASRPPPVSEVLDGGVISWSQRGVDRVRGKPGSRIKVTCPSGGRDAGWTYGTDIYTDDSMVCTAAVHAGVIGYGGGTFIVSIIAGLANYRGSTRNGITTSDYTAFPAAMVFSRP